MRNIEFRACSTVTGSFDFFTIESLLTKGCRTISKKSFDEDITIEQFTGVLDKNGAKIFEGDIVCITDDEIDSFEDVEHVVKWSDDAKWIVFRSNVDFYDLCDFDLVIIGNIHEAKQ